MRARALGILASGALVAAVLPVVGASSADALESPVVFTATAQPTYQTDGIAWAVASAQGKVFVGGSFSHVRPAGTSQGDANEVVRSNFVVLDAATGEPTDCQPAALLGTAEAATIRSLAVSPDGQTLYVGGSFSTFGGVNRGSLAALKISDCTVVSGWSPNPTATVRAIAVSPDGGTVYFGGQFLSVASGATARTHAAAAVAVGAQGAGTITSWAPSTTSTVDPTRNVPDVLAIAVRPNGSEVLLGGDFEDVNGTHSHGLAAVNSTTGALVWALTPPNIPWATSPTDLGYSSSVKSIVATDDGFFTGNEGTGSGSFDGRTSWSWSHTLNWKDGCLGATQALVVWSNALYSGSHAHNCSFINAYPDGARHHLLAETLTADPATATGGNPAFPALLPFFPNTNDGDPALFPRETGLEGIGPRGMAVADLAGANNDWLYVVGEFTSVDGTLQQGITRFGQKYNAQPSMPIVSLSSFTPGSARVAWLPSTDNDDATLTYTLERSTTGSGPWTSLQQTTQTATFWQRPQMVYTDTGRALGATYWYRVTVSDGTVSRTTTPKSVVITNVGKDLGGGSYGPSPYERAVLADSPELYLRYNEGGDVFLSDRSDNRDSMIFKGGGSFGAGLIASDASRALTLGGGAGQVAYSQKLMDSPTSYSLETWFSTANGYALGGKLIGFGNKQDYASNTFDKMLWMTNAGQLAFGVYTGSRQVLLSPLAYNDGARHHVVAVQDASSGMKLYVDGALVASNSVKTNQAYKGYWHVGGDNLVSWVGSAPYTTTSYAFAGTLDETAVYLSPLSASRVTAHFSAADQTGDVVQALTPQKPTVSIGSPADGATVKGVVPVSVFGSTTSGTTAHPDKLQLIIDGTPSASYVFDCGQTGYDCSTTFQWDAGGLLGTHTVAARITTVGGLAAPDDTATSATVTLDVLASAPPQAPTVSIDSPTAGSLVGPGTVDVHATASTPSGTVSYPASLDLIVDGKTAAPVTSVPCSGTSYECTGVLTWDASSVVGTHTIQVRANATSECQVSAATCSTTTSAVSVSVASATKTVVTPMVTVRSRTGVTVKGRVTLALTGAPVPGIPVKVTATPAVGSPGSRTGTTDANGYFSVPFSVATNTVFAAAAQPSSWYLGSSAGVRQYVTGVPVCTLSATTVRAGVRDVMTCKLSGLPTATPVALQYLVAGKWRTLVKTSSRTGAAYISFAIRAKGYWYLRTVIASNKTYYTSVSATARVRII